MKNFRDLQVWHKAHALVLESYKVTNAFPRQEMFSMTSQIRRAAVSIAANISEGCGKQGNGEFQRFLGMAAGSASELEYHFLLSRDLGFIAEIEYERPNSHVIEVKRMLASLLRKVNTERLPGKMLSAEC